MSQPLHMSLLDFKATLKKPAQWALSAGVLTAMITLFMPNHYKSEAKLLPADPNASGATVGLAAAAAAIGVGIGGAGGSDANFVDIMNSRWLMEQLLDPNVELHYRTRAWRFGPEHPETGSLYAYLNEENMDRAVKALDKIMDATKDLKSNVITLSVETKSPELSQLIVIRTTDLLNQFVVQNTRTRGTEKAAFAEARLADARHEMDQAEEAFRAFLEVNRNYLVSGDPATRLKGARLESELSLRRQLVTTLAMNREQSLLDAKNDIPILNVLDSGNLPIEKSKPKRSVIVMLTTLFVGVISWTWWNRAWARFSLQTFVAGTRARRSSMSRQTT